MSEAEPLRKRTDLAYLVKLAESLRAQLDATELDEDERVALIAEHLQARCVTCGAELGDEPFARWLLAFGPTPAAEGETMELMRLRRGCCGNVRCNARFYEFTFQPHETINWESLSVGALAEKEEPRRVSTAEIAARNTGDAVARQFTKRALICLAAFIILLFARAWYVGEEIPLFRPAMEFSGELPPSEDPVRSFQQQP